MKRKLSILSILLLFSNLISGQVSGKLLFESEPFPGVELKFKNSNESVFSDFDGNFSLGYKKKIETENILITYNGLTIEIEKVDLRKDKFTIGNFILPYYKSISINEYSRLSKTEQKNCFPIRHWTQLIGYYNCNKLESDFLELNCKKNIINFKYNPKTRTVKINWETIKNCMI